MIVIFNKTNNLTLLSSSSNQKHEQKKEEGTTQTEKNDNYETRTEYIKRRTNKS